MESLAVTAGSVDRLLHRPIYGGVFGHGRFSLASMPCVSRGLHSIRYLVVETRAGMVLSVSEDKTEALAGARRVLAASNELQAANDPEPQQLEIWPESDTPAEQPVEVAGEGLGKPVSRRRREIFEKGQGKCHYCETPLALHGKWHVEHMQPRALGGSEDLLNLVPACVKCNLSKSDLTAMEFVVHQAR